MAHIRGHAGARLVVGPRHCQSDCLCDRERILHPKAGALLHHGDQGAHDAALLLSVPLQGWEIFTDLLKMYEGLAYIQAWASLCHGQPHDKSLPVCKLNMPSVPLTFEVFGRLAKISKHLSGVLACSCWLLGLRYSFRMICLVLPEGKGYSIWTQQSCMHCAE